MKRTKKLEANAYHEAGHAVAAWQYKAGMKSVTIEEQDDCLGQVEYTKILGDISLRDLKEEKFWGNVPWHIRKIIERRAIVALAGPLAEKRIQPHGDRWLHSHHDYDSALTVIRYIASGDEEVNAYIWWLTTRVEIMLDKTGIWPAVVALAEALLEHGTIPGRKATAILSSSSRWQIPQYKYQIQRE